MPKQKKKKYSILEETLLKEKDIKISHTHTMITVMINFSGKTITSEMRIRKKHDKQESKE